MIGDDRMVDHEIERNHRRYTLRIAAKTRNCVAHRCQIADRRDARGVVHHHARRHEMDFTRRAPAFAPRQQGCYIVRIPAAR